MIFLQKGKRKKIELVARPEEEPEVEPSVLLRPPDEAAEGERLGEVMLGSPPLKGERTFDPPPEEVTS